MDIIDFRYRPPYGSYRETIMYRDLERARRCSEAFGMTQSPAVAARDMEASLTEMDRAGIGMAVLAGRKVLPHIGIVDNQDIVDLIHAYPGRFTGMAGVDPSDGPEAMEGMLDRMEQVLGRDRASRFHSHFSHIEFTPKGGEYRHLCFEDEGWGPDFVPLAAAVARRDWSPSFICESAGTQSEDALEMKTLYVQEVKRK